MATYTMTKAEARAFLVVYHHLNSEPLVGKEGILDYIEQVGSIQFDPLDQVGNNPHLVLQSRIANYHKQDLYDLLYKNRELMDGWDKCLSIYKASDWIKFKRYHMATKHYDRFIDQQKDEKEHIVGIVRETIKNKGPVSSSDIEIDGQMDWHWAPTTVARAALEYMYYSGDLIIHHKKGTRKYYDLMEYYYDQTFLESEDGFNDNQEFYNWLLLRRISSVGILWDKASDAFVGIRGLTSTKRHKGFIQLVEQGLIIPITIEGSSDVFYIKTCDTQLAEAIKENKIVKNQVAFLAPLDNMLWDRKLILELFDFDYKWEVYTPKEKRRYGYYVLPILYRSELVGRFEPVLDKKKNILYIRNWWWEPSFKLSIRFEKALLRAVKKFGKYLDAEEVHDERGLLEI